MSTQKKKKSVFETIENESARLDELVREKEKANRPKGYGEYLGQTLTLAREEAARAKSSAEVKRDRAAVGYGTGGESIAQKGLASSGYADYLKNAAARSYDAEIASAEATYAKAKEKGERSYKDYLERHETAEDEILHGLIKSMAKNGIESYDEGYRFGVSEGLSGERAELFARMCDAYGNQSFRTIGSSERISLLREIMQNGLDYESTYLYARAIGASSATAKKIATLAEGMRGRLGEILE